MFHCATILFLCLMTTISCPIIIPYSLINTPLPHHNTQMVSEMCHLVQSHWAIFLLYYSSQGSSVPSQYFNVPLKWQCVPLSFHSLPSHHLLCLFSSLSGPLSPSQCSTVPTQYLIVTVISCFITMPHYSIPMPHTPITMAIFPQFLTLLTQYSFVSPYCPTLSTTVDLHSIIIFHSPITSPH